MNCPTHIDTHVRTSRRYYVGKKSKKFFIGVPFLARKDRTYCVGAYGAGVVFVGTNNYDDNPRAHTYLRRYVAQQKVRRK